MRFYTIFGGVSVYTVRIINLATMFPGPQKHNLWVVLQIRVPFWYPLNIRCRNITYNQKGSIVLRTTLVIVVGIQLLAEEVEGKNAATKSLGPSKPKRHFEYIINYDIHIHFRRTPPPCNSGTVGI